MKSYKFSVLLIALLLIFSSVSTSSPVFASDRGNISISIDPSTNGIVIRPGSFPDLGTDVSSIQENAGEMVVNKGKAVAKVVTAICALVCLVVWFISLAKLASSSGNPFIRRQAIIGLLYSAIVFMLFGGAWFVVSFFWNILAA